MRKHRTILIFLGLAGPFALLAFAIARNREPTYDGHRLSYWVERHWLERNQESVRGHRPHTTHDNAEKAILAIGTNGIPWLLEWMRCEPNPVPKPILNRVQWSFWNTRIGGVIMFGSRRRNMRAEAAVLAFDRLGTNAEPAVNDLVLLMQDSSRPWTSVRATVALGSLGPCALPALTQALFTTNQHQRQLVALELFDMSHDPAVGTNKILPFVIWASKDPDPQVRKYASDFLARIAPAATTNSSGQ